MSTLELSEVKLCITMTSGGRLGCKGFNPVQGFTHKLYGVKVVNREGLNEQSSVTGNIPSTVVLGRNPDEIEIECSLNMRWPTEIDDYLETLKPYRKVSHVKNIFLVGSIVTVASQSPDYPREFPIGSRWYIKKYLWVRGTDNPVSPKIALKLMKWYREDI